MATSDTFLFQPPNANENVNFFDTRVAPEDVFHFDLISPKEINEDYVQSLPDKVCIFILLI